MEARAAQAAARSAYTEAAAEVRRVLAGRLKGPVPADLVITTRREIEQREFQAYAQGWRDRGEHEEHRRAEAAPGPSRSSNSLFAEAPLASTPAPAPPGSRRGGKVLPFPQHSPHAERPPHPSGPAGGARPHPHDDPS